MHPVLPEPLTDPTRPPEPRISSDTSESARLHDPQEAAGWPNLTDTPARDVVAGHRHRLAAALLVVLAPAVSSWLFARIWQRAALEDIPEHPGGWPAVPIVVLASAVVHEIFRAATWKLLGGVPWRSMSVRPSWRAMGLVATTETSMPARVLRASALAPALLLAAPTILSGLALDRGLLLFWGNFFLLECWSDLGVLLATWRVPPTASVVELQGRLGCRITGRQET